MAAEVVPCFFSFFLPSSDASASVRSGLDPWPLFQASVVPVVSFTPDGLRVLSLTANRCPMLARGLQMEKAQQELMNHERSTSVRI